MASTSSLTQPRKKRRVHVPDELPFPVPIETLTHKPASNGQWFYYQAKMVNNNVIVQNEGDMIFLHKMGFFGKGILSRSKPEHQFCASSFQGLQRKNLPPKERRFQQQRFQQIRQHKYERHLSWRKQLSQQKKGLADQVSGKEAGKDSASSPIYKLPAIPAKRVKRATVSERNHRAGITVVDRKKEKSETEEGQFQVPATSDEESLSHPQGPSQMAVCAHATSGETASSHGVSDGAILMPAGNIEKQNVFSHTQCGLRRSDHGDRDQGLARSGRLLPESDKRELGKFGIDEKEGDPNSAGRGDGDGDDAKGSIFHSEQNVQTNPDSAVRCGQVPVGNWAGLGHPGQSHLLTREDAAECDQQETRGHKNHLGSSWETKPEDWADVGEVAEPSGIVESCNVSLTQNTAVRDMEQIEERTVADCSPHRRLSSDTGRLLSKGLVSADMNPATCMSTALFSSGRGKVQLNVDHVQTFEQEAECVADRAHTNDSCASASTSATDQRSAEEGLDDLTTPGQSQDHIWAGGWTCDATDWSDIQGIQVATDYEKEAQDEVFGQLPGSAQGQETYGDEEGAVHRQEKVLPFSPGRGHDLVTEGVESKPELSLRYEIIQEGALEGCHGEKPGGLEGDKVMEWEENNRARAGRHRLQVKKEEEVEREERAVNDDAASAGATSEEEKGDEHCFPNRGDDYLDDSHGNANDILVAVPTPVEFENATTSQTESNNLLCLKGRTVRKKVRDTKVPVRHSDPYPIFEYLQLSYEEAFFLSYGLGCLNLEDTNKKPMNLTEMWRTFKRQQSSFVANYIVYHFFRSKGWVPKTGLKFGADFILYKKGPPFYHASYCVYVAMVNEEDIDQGSFHHKMTWASLMGMDRVIENAAKELMFCFVIKPTSLTKRDLDSPACIPRFKVQEILMKRWVPSR